MRWRWDRHEIVDIAVPMGAPMRNAVIDFSKMTVSAVAVVTDVVRGGKPVVGFGFNANGRYAQSAVIRERLAPRVLEAPEEHASADGTTLDPRAIRRLMMRNEKPGGHGERAVAVAALDIAVWDAAAKLRDMPLWALIAEDAGNPAPEQSIPVYAAGGYYDPDKGTDGLVAEMRRYLDEGYTQVKMKIGGATLDEDRDRIEAVLALLGGDGSRLAVDANGRFDERPRAATRAPSSPTASPGTRSRATRWTSPSTRRWWRPTPTRSRPARTCSRCRTRATCCASAGCGPRSTTCSSTPPWPTAWARPSTSSP